jgi:hypothetical protein
MMFILMLRGPQSGSGGSSGTKGSSQGSLENASYDSSVTKASQTTNEAPSISNDPLVGETVSKIQKDGGQKINGVNTKKETNGRITNEIDIETDDAVIEVKSGGTKHHFNQFARQKAYADKQHKRYIIYGPNLRGGVLKELRKRGYDVATSYDELLKLLGKRKK